MIDPYRMVVVNALLLIFFASIITIIKLKFPHKKVSYPALLFFISVIPLVSILRKGTYESGALSEYVKLSYNFYENLISGIFIPQWAPYLCTGYGCPDFIYMYSLPYYIVSVVHFIGFSFIVSIKLLLAGTYISSGFAMYFFAKEFMQKKYAFASAIIYLFAPYHLVNLHFQVDIAEMTAMTILPIVFLFGYKTLTSRQFVWVCGFIASIAFLILSHPVISISTLPFVGLFGVMLTVQKNKISTYSLLYFFTSMALGLLLTTYYWLPAMLESKYILWGIRSQTTVTPLIMMLFSPWRFGFLFQGPTGQLSFFLGFAHWLIIFITGIYLYRQRHNLRKHSLLLFCFGSFLLLFISISEIATPIWNLPILKSFQMTYRLLVQIAFFTSLMGGILLSRLQNKLLWTFIVFLAISTTILNWGNRRTIQEIDDTYLIRELKFKLPPGIDPTFPKWTEFDQKYTQQLPPTRISVLSGEAEITQTKFLPTIHQYVIDAKNDVTMLENTFYYPGWNLYVDNKKVLINYENPQHKGLITFQAEKGLHFVELKFEQTTNRIVARMISLASIAAAIVFVFLPSVRKRMNALH